METYDIQITLVNRLIMPCTIEGDDKSYYVFTACEYYQNKVMSQKRAPLR